MKNFNVVILGGGTAGWLTALYLDKYFKGSNITLIESDKIGVLGAGEGTTPHIIDCLRFLDIDIFDLIKQTGGTIKNGICFENWNGDNKKYFHGFNDINVYTILDLLNKKIDLDKNIYSSYLSYKNKIDLHHVKSAIHFDANKVAEYLKSIALVRGVKLKKGEYLKIDSTKDIITKIYLKDKTSYKCDFVFDCSGFSRLLIGKHYRSKWIDYTKYLTLNTAVPWKIKQDKDPKPYTQAIAMKNGWVWKIPLQHRFGSGYIYDSNYTSTDKVIEEAEKTFKTKIEPIKELKFKAGRFEKVWIGNCISVGLSSGFTEPLEATSIWLSISQLKLLENFLGDVVNTTQSVRDTYNSIVELNNEKVLAFLYLHYITKRKDSMFWKTYLKRTDIPSELQKILSKIEDGTLNNLDVTDKCNAFFGLDSWLVVSKGLGLIKKTKDMRFYNVITPYETYKHEMKEWEKESVLHKDFLREHELPR